ncbi:MAG: hypothetical protein JRG86_22965 [Deltaproteobacteria bacterium]|jgi:hypothetical protein|nr:hypothetical protein [Deltaproteobacteria bacterium]MBW2499817.1 hypothetical protein [Deltaproteobacteria bacterium]
MIALSWFWRIVLATIAITMLLPLVAGIDSGLTPESPWSGQVGNVPFWLQIWLMGILSPAFLGSLFFLRRSIEARFVAGGFVLSHVPMMIHLFDVTVGVVGVMHLVCWTPALVLLARRQPRVDVKSPFGFWVHAMLFVLAVSLAFDLRDALRFYLA